MQVLVHFNQHKRRLVTLEQEWLWCMPCCKGGTWALGGQGGINMKCRNLRRWGSTNHGKHQTSWWSGRHACQ